MAKALALARPSPVAAVPGFQTLRALLLLVATAFFVAWESLLFVPTSISRYSSFCRMRSSRLISFSLFLASVLGCDVALFSALEISSALVWTRRVFRFLRIDRAGFLR